MTIKQIPYDKLSEAVKVGFYGDIEIAEFYDPNIKPKDLNDIVSDICRKSETYGMIEGEMKYYEVFIENNLAGYFYGKQKLLISFAMNVAYRTTEYLRMFFNYIRKTFGQEFYCVLWTRNKRAIRWLCKMGMKVEIDDYLFEGNLLSRLKY